MKNSQWNRIAILLFLTLLNPIYFSVDAHADLFGDLVNQAVRSQEDEKIKKENEEAAKKEKNARAAMRAAAKAEEARVSKWKEDRRLRQQAERKRKAEEYERTKKEWSRVYELRKKEAMENKPRKKTRYSNILSKYDEDGILTRAEKNAVSELSARHYEKLKKEREDAEKLEAEKKAERFRKSNERMAEFRARPKRKLSPEEAEKERFENENYWKKQNAATKKRINDQKSKLLKPFRKKSILGKSDWKELRAVVHTADYGDASANYLNPQSNANLLDLYAFKNVDKGKLVIVFELKGETRYSSYHEPFLIRLFDKNGEIMKFFKSKETAGSLVNEYTDEGEEVQTLAFSIPINILRDVAQLEFGFMN
jgi:hypothetical protein